MDLVKFCSGSCCEFVEFLFVGFFKVKEDLFQDFSKFLLILLSELRIQDPTRIDSRFYSGSGQELKKDSAKIFSGFTEDLVSIFVHSKRNPSENPQWFWGNVSGILPRF